LIPSGGGIGRGGGLPIGRGLDDGGFSKRKPAIKEQMLTEVKVSDDDITKAQSAMVDHTNIVSDLEAHADVVESHVTDRQLTKYKVKDGAQQRAVKILGNAGTVFKRKDVTDKINQQGDNIIKLRTKKGENNDDVIRDHAPIDFTGQTTSKGIVFTKDSGEVLKFRSIAALSKASGLSKYKILGKFKPKKIGDKLRHDTLLGGGSIEFVGKQGLNAATV
jgi:hypothetical protein